MSIGLLKSRVDTLRKGREETLVIFTVAKWAYDDKKIFQPIATDKVKISVNGAERVFGVPNDMDAQSLADTLVDTLDSRYVVVEYL